MSKNSNTSDFIKKAKLVHGDLYDYKEVLYVKAIEKVKIICNKHGIFLQQPNNHLTGYGCKKCSIDLISKNRINSIEYFIEKASKLHKNKYDYSLVKKGMNQVPVKIICPKHGMFLQPPIRHLFGKGCNKCGIEQRALITTNSLENWINQANLIHSYTYDYSKTIYVKKELKVTITCKYHGDFLQTPHAHLSGSGCQICAKIIQNVAYKKEKNPIADKISCHIYILNIYNQDENFYKIGISTNILNRFNEINSLYKKTILYSYESNLLFSVSLEQKILKDLKNNIYLPKRRFGGHKECLNINPLPYLLDCIKNV